MKATGKPSGDPIWDLATSLIQKRTKPGDSVKSILKDLRFLYAGLKRLAPKSVSETPLERVSKWLRGDDEGRPKASVVKGRALRIAKR
jgi:hypothetical protein